MKKMQRNIWLGITIMLLVAFGTYVSSKKTGNPLEQGPVETDNLQSGQASQGENSQSANSGAQAQTTAGVTPDDSNGPKDPRIVEKESRFPRYVELTGTQKQFNTDHDITIGEYIGKKVIIVDFWTYSCINCQRTLPYITSWWDKYKDQGLLIIGVHTPEFDFEKDADNLQKAIEKFGVEYPVVQDNNFQTWRAYKNRYWPRKYMIDIDGFIVYDHIGEGAYKETEQLIQQLLEERKEVLGEAADIPKSITSFESDSGQIAVRAAISPEMYFGYGTLRGNFGNTAGPMAGETAEYTLPAEMAVDNFYLEGNWLSNKDNLETTGPTSKMLLKYRGRQVNIVAGAMKSSTLSLKIDGNPLTSDQMGTDVNEDGTVVISPFGLYGLVQGEYGTHTLEITAQDPGIMLYTFTFG
ncbi:MAG: thiol-disulfide isomerase [archaeon GW2011_AR3]|nr:MAG: thiol-disulfide isomerase [archaeon GW2011_AR3]MBS3109733.1 redoxin domain-containing protein [Candidatus Woesearchaeota archaeon]